MRRQLFWLSVYAIAMAYLEASVVIYIRELYHPENIRMIFPSQPLSMFDFWVEIGREAATIIMMLGVAFIFERKNGTRIFAAFVYQFGIWDIFYYIWLKTLIGWPVSWTEWDILFLIPWVWLGPWITPAAIALPMAIWGGMILGSKKEHTFSGWPLRLFVAGAVLDLISFLQPAVTVMSQSGVKGFTNYHPGNFWWWLFIPGYLLMITGLFQTFYIQSPKPIADPPRGS
ncbi:MAG: hypothetical protein P8184_01295 [Calditrichia bacterium]